MQSRSQCSKQKKRPEGEGKGNGGRLGCLRVPSFPTIFSLSLCFIDIVSFFERSARLLLLCFACLLSGQGPMNFVFAPQSIDRPAFDIGISFHSKLLCFILRQYSLCNFHCPNSHRLGSMSNSGTDGCYGAEQQMLAKPKVKLPRRSKDSVAFHRDPFNKPEHVHTLRGRELVLFVLLYVLGVVCIVVLFESIMPVFFVDEDVRTEQRRRAAIVFGQVKPKVGRG